MQTAFKKFVLYFLAGVLLLTLASCEETSNGFLNAIGGTNTSDSIPTIAEAEDRIPEIIPEETTPEATSPKEENSGDDEQTTTVTDFDESSVQQTTPEEMISTDITLEQETPEITNPEETTTTVETTTFEQTTTPEEGMGEPQETTVPEETTTPEPPHEHIMINGQCVCGYAIVLENESLFDNDKDGDMDIFYFSSVLPERFTAKNALHFGADEYDSGLSSWVGISYEGGDTYYFCRNDRKSYIVYEVEVAQAGVYEMAICQRMKDTEVHGAKFTVNEDSDEKYIYATSYQFANEQDMTEVCENTSTMSSYMFGIELELAAGVNYIKIELAPGIESGQYFRDFYLVKTSK